MTSPLNLADDLAFAKRLADRAAGVALKFFHRGVETIIKEDNTPVSEADLEVDRQMVEELVRERPDDAVLSEESGARPGTSNRRWIIDPIDGTFNFVEGRPAWGTHVALEVDGELVLGVITRPVYEQRWWATAGGGAFTQGTGADATVTRLQVSETTDLAQSRITVWRSQTEERLEQLAQGFVLVRPATLDNILQVAGGELDGVIESMGKIWDHAPAAIIVAEAGGSFRDREGGRRLDLGASRYTNGRIDELLERFLSG
ncbi:MAG: inositol monophosphatase family protein [Acidimicrobiia bacterium]